MVCRIITGSLLLVTVTTGLMFHFGLVDPPFNSLHTPVYNGVVEEVARLIAEGARPDISFFWFGDTLLHMAARMGESEVLLALLQSNSSIRIDRLSGNETALHVATEGGHLAMVQALLQKGANPNLKSTHEATPVLIAAKAGHASIVQLLLHAGAELHRDNRGRGPLILAAQNNHLDVVLVLLAHGVDADEADVHGTTALKFASQRGYLEVAQALLQKGARADVLDSKLLLQAASRGDRDILNLFPSDRSVIDTTDQHGATPLLVASEKGQVDFVEALLDKGADPNAKNAKGETALLLAASRGDLQLLTLLLDKGADPNAKNAKGETASLLAASRGDLQLLTVLLDKGADVSVRGRGGEGLLHLAVQGGHSDMMALALDKGADASMADLNGTVPLAHALKQQDLEMVISLLNYTDAASTTRAISPQDSRLFFRLLVSNDVRLQKVREIANMTVLLGAELCGAARAGHLHIVKLLLANGVGQTVCRAGRTPLHESAVGGHSDVVEVLLNHSGFGLNEAQVDALGMTSLHLGTLSGSKATVQLLLSKGSAVGVRDRLNCTALLYATLLGHVEVASLLLDQGADVNVRIGTIDLRSLLPVDVASASPMQHALYFRQWLSGTMDSELASKLLGSALKGRAGELLSVLLERALDDAGAGAVPRPSDDTTLQKAHRSANGLFALAHEAATIGSTPHLRLWPTMLVSKLRTIAQLIMDMQAGGKLISVTQFTPLHVASTLGRHDIVPLLLSRGAIIDSENGDGLTPMLLAARMGHVDVVSLLLQAGANVVSEALTEALKRNHDAVADLLLGHASHQNVAK